MRIAPLKTLVHGGEILFCYFLTKGLPKKAHLEIFNFLTALEIINIITKGF